MVYTDGDMTNNTNDKQWASLVFFGGAVIWAHGATREAAAQAVAKQARRDLRQYLPKKKAELACNLYEVAGRSWSYDDYEGMTLEDGTRVACDGNIRVEA